MKARYFSQSKLQRNPPGNPLGNPPENGGNPRGLLEKILSPMGERWPSNRRRTRAGLHLMGSGLAITLIGALTYFIQQTLIMSRFDARPLGLILTLAGIGLCVLGFVREQWTEDVVWRQSLGVKVIPVALALTALYVGNTYFAFSQQEVRFTNGDVSLVGTLLIPRGAAPHPALAMIHGAGSATRMGNFVEAQSLARHGVAVLMYDKRGSGASVGGHPRYDGYAALARDGVAAVDFLRSRSDIDPNQVGLWGTSEGGWTAPMAAAQIVDLAFLIIVSGGPLTPEEQGRYEMEYRLRGQGFDDESIEEALQLDSQISTYYQTGEGREKLVAALEQAQEKVWFAAAEDLPLTVPPVEAFSEHVHWWRAHMDTDVAPLIEEMDFPILFVLGANDPLIPAQRVKAQVESLLGAAGHPDFKVEIFPNATHNLISAPVNCTFCIPDEGIGPIRLWFAPGYLDLVSDWVVERVESAS